MQKNFEIEQELPEIWGFKGLEMILLRETKKRKKYHCVPLPCPKRNGLDYQLSCLRDPGGSYSKALLGVLQSTPE